MGRWKNIFSFANKVKQKQMSVSSLKMRQVLINVVIVVSIKFSLHLGWPMPFGISITSKLATKYF